MHKDPLIPGEAYHIYNRANGSENLFREPDNYRYFMTKLVERTHPVLKILAWCLMPNHFHLLIRLKDEGTIMQYNKDQDGTQSISSTIKNLSMENQAGFIVHRQLSKLMIGYAKAYNKKYKRRGSLLQQNTKRKLIDNEAYLRRVCLYIHFNPVHHGFVKHPEHWYYSSYEDYIYDYTSFIEKTELLSSFGGRSSFKDAHHQYSKAITSSSIHHS